MTDKTLVEIMEHIEDAARHIRHMPSAWVKSTGTYWPDYVRNSYGDPDPLHYRIRLTSEEVTNVEHVILHWLPSVRGDQARIIWAKAHNYSFRKIMVAIPKLGIDPKTGKYKLGYRKDQARRQFLEGVCEIQARLSKGHYDYQKKK